jgi:hypothetical protein
MVSSSADVIDTPLKVLLVAPDRVLRGASAVSKPPCNPDEYGFMFHSADNLMYSSELVVTLVVVVVVVVESVWYSPGVLVASNVLAVGGCGVLIMLLAPTNRIRSQQLA